MSRRARTVPVVLGACIAFITLVVLTGSEVKHQLGGRHASRRSAIETRHGVRHQRNNWIRGRTFVRGCR